VARGLGMIDGGGERSDAKTGALHCRSAFCAPAKRGSSLATTLNRRRALSGRYRKWDGNGDAISFRRETGLSGRGLDGVRHFRTLHRANLLCLPRIGSLCAAGPQDTGFGPSMLVQ
jgi:hypothetical protein